MERSGDTDLAMGLFPHSFVDSADYAQANLNYSAPRRALYRQTNRLERAVAATDGLVAACHHHSPPQEQ